MQPVFSLFPKTGTRLRSLHEEGGSYNCTPPPASCQTPDVQKIGCRETWQLRGDLFARPPKCRLKLVLLRVFLRAELAFFRLAVEVSARTVVQGRSFVLPDGYAGISSV